MNRSPGFCTNEPSADYPRTYSVEYVHQTLLGNRSLRTIQRWRVKLGLPKPKIIGDGPSSLKCYLADEIDAWITMRLKRSR